VAIVTEHHILNLPAIRIGYTKKRKAIWRKPGRLYYYFGNFFYPIDLPDSLEATVIAAIKKFMAENSELVKRDREHPDYQTLLQLAGIEDEEITINVLEIGNE
jgi:hypothetical protein